jgi:phosphatidate cytidylyltransferase
MQRLLTALVATPALLAAVFLLPGEWFFVLTVLVVEWAVVEYVRLVRPAAPGAPLGALVLLVPLAALALLLATTAPATLPATVANLRLLAAGLVLTVGVGSLVLLARTPVHETLPAFGAFAFGLPYFSLAALGLSRLQQLDPWLLFLGFAIIFLGDTGAFYVGRRFGRHKMAPVVSPNKSWEGAVAGLVTGLLAAAVWGWFRLGSVAPELLALALATGVAAQVGDLVESMLKRGSGVKDSGRMLPGHGGLLDRADALFFAVPVLLFGVWLLGAETLIP